MDAIRRNICRPSNTSSTQSTGASRMPLIHNGDSTHHQDQSITPVSLSTMSAGNERAHRS